MAHFPNLLSPVALGTLTVPNRIVMSAHGTRLAKDGVPTEALIRYYEERAKGGTGLIVVSTYAVHPHRDEGGFQPQLYSRNPNNRPLHREMIDRVIAHGTRMLAQIGYGGRQVSGEGVLRPVMAPSRVPWVLGGEVPREMTRRDIAAMVRSYGQAAAGVRDLGYEGVEIHGAHGYLVHEFLSPAANRRTDDYGGSFENRVRFLVEVIQAVRSEVGRDFPVGLRLSGDEFVEGGTTLDHQARVAGVVRDLGLVDYLSQSAGAYRSMERIVLPPHYEQGSHLELARQMKVAASPIPLMTVGRIFEPAYADEIIGGGAADLVVMTRALIADPYLARKAAGDHDAPLRHCVGAMECWRRTRKNFAVSCAVNPEAGRESRFPVAAAKETRTVAVVGAGPAGMEAAVRLADAGHRVVVLERGAQTGGRLNLAVRANGFQAYERFITYQRAEAARRPGIAIELAVEATPAVLRDLNAAAVVIATGATPRRPEQPLHAGALSLDAALRDVGAAGGTVCIYAETRHLAPLAVADTLAASGRRVTLITPHPQVGADLDPNTYNTVRRRLAEAGVVIVAEALLDSARPGTVVVHDVWPAWPLGHSGAVREIACDTLLYDIGDEPNEALTLELAGSGFPVITVGDCVTPRGVIGATWDGSGVVAVVEQRLHSLAPA